MGRSLGLILHLASNCEFCCLSCCGYQHLLSAYLAIRGMFMWNRTYYGEKMQVTKANHQQRRPAKKLNILRALPCSLFHISSLEFTIGWGKQLTVTKKGEIFIQQMFHYSRKFTFSMKKPKDGPSRQVLTRDSWQHLFLESASFMHWIFTF